MCQHGTLGSNRTQGRPVDHSEITCTVEEDKDHPLPPFQRSEELPPLLTGWDSLARALRLR